MQDRRSLSTNSTDTSISQSKQLDYAIPQSTISTLSAGQFVGVVADTPDQPIPQKMFHSEFQQDFKKMSIQKSVFKLEAEVPESVLKNSFLQIKREIKELVVDQIGHI